MRSRFFFLHADSFSLMCHSVKLPRKIAAQNSGCVFAYFRLQFRSFFKEAEESTCAYDFFESSF